MNVHIPKEIKVCYNEREETYTGKLGFVTYQVDEGGMLHGSAFYEWGSKCKSIVGSNNYNYHLNNRSSLHNKVKVDTFNNVPKRGYIINRNKSHYSSSVFNYKRLVFRVYHPDGFEFEIKPDNLNMILDYVDISKKEIMDECVIAFTGKQIVLLPVASEAYQKYNEKINKKLLKEKDLENKKNKIYKDKTNDLILYLGKKEIEYLTRDIQIMKTETKKVDVFYNINQDKYITLTSAEFKKLKEDSNLFNDVYKDKINKENIIINNISIVQLSSGDIIDVKNNLDYLFLQKNGKVYSINNLYYDINSDFKVDFSKNIIREEINSIIKDDDFLNLYLQKGLIYEIECNINKNNINLKDNNLIFDSSKMQFKKYLDNYINCIYQQ